MTVPRHSAGTLLLAGCALAALLGSAGPAMGQDSIVPIRGQQDLADRAEALQKPPGYEGREEGELITVDFASGTFVGPAGGGLPFDVSFKLKGPITEGYEELSARFIEFNRVPDCRGFFRAAEILVARDDAIPVRPRRPARAIESSGFRGAVFTADKKNFVVELPPLRPNHYYCFEFVSKQKVDQAVLDELRGKFADAVDAEFRKEQYVGTLSEGAQRSVFRATELSDYEQLRRTLINLVEAELAPGQTLLAPQGSFFDVNTSFDGVTRDYRERFQRIPEKSVDQRQDAIREYRAFIGRASATLRKLATMSFGMVGDDDSTATVFDILAAPDLQADLEEVKARTKVDLQELFEQAASGRTIEALKDPGVDALWKKETAEDHPVDDKIVALLELSEAVGSLVRLAGEVGIDVSIPEEDEGGFQAGLVDEATAGQQGTAADTFGSLVLDAVEQLGIYDPNDPDSSGATAKLFDLRKVLDQRWASIQDLTRELFVELRQVVRISGTTVANYETRAIWYMSADLGSGISWDTEDLFTYIGWNMYFRPVNKKAHLSWAGRPYGVGEEFMRRFSVTLGLVQSGFEEENGRFKGVVGNRAAVIGAGFRVNDSLRLSFGGLLFENEDPNPLITTTTLNWSPYAALSFDWNATKTFARIFSAVSGGG